VAALSTWLLFRTRHELATASIAPSPIAGAVLLLSTIVWFVFYRAGIQTLHILMLPVLMGLAITTAFGFRAACVVAFPLAFLYFGTPAWGLFVDPLQWLTTKAVGVLAPMLGIPARMQGYLVVLPGVGTFDIERGCSGANFLATGLAVAALLGELERASIIRRAALLSFMGAAAIVSNWVRVLVVVDAGYTTHMRHVLVSRGHLMFGWVLFTTVMVAFVWIFSRPRTSAPITSPRGDMVSRTPVFTYVATIFALVAMPAVVYILVSNLDMSVLPVVFHAPAGRAGWRGPLQTAATWQPDFVGPHSQWHFAYEDTSSHNVEMVAIAYSLQGQGRELVNEENSLFGGGAVTLIDEAKVSFDGARYMELVTADDKGRRSLIWSVYDIGGREFVTPLLSQLWYGVRSLIGPPYSAQFAFRTVCEPSCDSARTVLGSFLRALGPNCFASVGRAARPDPTLRPL
jgi:EpsI family protein